MRISLRPKWPFNLQALLLAWPGTLGHAHLPQTIRPADPVADLTSHSWPCASAPGLSGPACRLAIFGIAFLIAFICQLENTFTRKFHYEMKDHLPKWLIWFVIVTGEPANIFIKPLVPAPNYFTMLSLPQGHKLPPFMVTGQISELPALPSYLTMSPQTFLL